MNEKELIDKIKNGDKEAFLYLVESYRKKLIMFCYSYTNDVQEAEDISQDVFVKFYKSLYSFRFECSITTYLFYIARSKCIDFIRRKRIKEIFSGLSFFIDEKNDIDCEERLFIRKCVLELPEKLRTVVVLYYYIGLTEKEIGRILNITPKAVEGRLYRAKQKLRKELEKGEVLVCNREETV